MKVVDLYKNKSKLARKVTEKPINWLTLLQNKKQLVRIETEKNAMPKSNFGVKLVTFVLFTL